MMVNEHQPADVPVRRLKQYELIQLMGRGSQSQLYRAREDVLQRIVAIRLLNSELSADTKAVWQFFSQAAAAARVLHRNIAQIYFVGQDGTHCFCARECVEGVSLGKRLALETSLGQNEAFDISLQILEGLVAAHGLGLVHGNLHSNNVLLEDTGSRVVLSDFCGSDSVAPSSTTVAPQMTTGVQTDLQSVGRLLQQMLGGTDAASSAPASPLETSKAGQPLTLWSVSERLLTTDGSTAITSAAEALAAVQRLAPVTSTSLQRSSESTAPEATAWKPQCTSSQTAIIELPVIEDIPDLPDELFDHGRQSRGWRQWIGDWWLRTTPEVARRLQDTHAAVDGALAEMQRRARWLDQLVAEGQRVLAFLHTQLIENKTSSSKRLNPESPNDLAKAIQAQEQQIEEINRRRAELAITIERLEMQRDVLNARLKVAQARFQIAGGQPSQRAASRTLRHLAVAAQVGLVVALFSVAGVLIWKSYRATSQQQVVAQQQTVTQQKEAALAEPRSKAPLQVRPPIQELPDLAWVPESMAVVPLRSLRGYSKSNFSFVNFCSGRPLVAAASGDGTVRIWSAESGRQVQELVNVAFGEPRAVNHLDFSGDGTLINDWDWSTGRSKQAGAEVASDITSRSYSPDGKQFAAIMKVNTKSSDLRSDNELAVVFDAQSGELLGRVTPDQQNLQQVLYSPAQPLIAYHDGSGIIKLWDAKQRAVVRQLNTTNVRVNDICFSHNGQLLAAASQDGAVRIWKVTDDSAPMTFATNAPRPEPLKAVAFDSKDQLVAAIGGGVATVWGVAQQKVVRYCVTDYRKATSRTVINGRALDNGEVSFSDDGRFLVTNGLEAGPPLIWDMTDPPPSKTANGNAASSVANDVGTADQVTAIRRLRYLELTRQTNDPDFQRSLKTASAAFPKAEVSTNQSPAVWREVTLNQAGLGFDGIRFSSPLAAPADIYCCVAATESTKATAIGSTKQPRLKSWVATEDYNLQFSELRAPNKNHFQFYSLNGGHIRPGDECVWWFAFHTQEPVVIKFALHLDAEISTLSTIPTSDQIAQKMNWQIPLNRTPLPVSIGRQVFLPQEKDEFNFQPYLLFSGEQFSTVPVRGYSQFEE